MQNLRKRWRLYWQGVRK